MGKTKLDSIDKVVDLIRTVSRDISPESTKYCDCYNEFYQEKENQTDDAMCQSIEFRHDCASKIESQQAEIEHLHTELDKKVGGTVTMTSKLIVYFIFSFNLFINVFTFILFIN